MEENSLLINKRDTERGWLNNLSDHLAQLNKQPQTMSKLAKYADFVCLQCNKMFTRTAAIDHNQGRCDGCGSEITHVSEVQETETKKSNHEFECVKCGITHPRTALKEADFKCDCGGNKFVNQELLNQVCANTVAFLGNKGIKIDNIKHEKGVVYASLSGTEKDGVQWTSNIKTAGKFTRNDVIIFQWTPNGGTATVATAQDDPIIKLAKNEKAKIKWEVIDNNTQVVLHDIAGKEVSIGSNLAWYAKSGPIKGQVVKASRNGELVVGLTETAEFGKSKGGFFDEIVLTQEHINNWGIAAE